MSLVQPTPAVVVIGPQFCTGLPVELTIVRKSMTLSRGHFRVSDVNGNIVFKVKGKLFKLHHRRVMYDAAGNPIITLQRKLACSTWKVFRGESTAAGDKLFSIKNSSFLEMIRHSTKNLHVYLASNTREKVRDYKIEDRWFQKSCALHDGNSNNILAQMERNPSVQSILLAVNPNVDYAFVVALAVLIDDMGDELIKKPKKAIRKFIAMRIIDLLINIPTGRITN